MKKLLQTIKKAAVGILSSAMLLTSLFSAFPVSARSALADDGGFYTPFANTDLWTEITDQNKPGINTAYDESGAKIGVHLAFNGGNFTKRVISRSKI